MAENEPPGPVLRPTKPLTLVVAAGAAAPLAWLLMRGYYGAAWHVDWITGASLGLLGMIEAVMARIIRARIARKPRAGTLNPLAVARSVVLAKASSLTGAIFAGAYAGVTLWAAAEFDLLRVAKQTLVPGIIGVIGALALTAGALLLERSGRIPPQDEGGQPGSGGRRSDGAPGGRAPSRKAPDSKAPDNKDPGDGR